MKRCILRSGHQGRHLFANTKATPIPGHDCEAIERKRCIGNDPLCPCQDGDMCHYAGPNPWPLPRPNEYSADCPTCLRGLPHSQAQHEASLRRAVEGSHA